MIDIVQYFFGLVRTDNLNNIELNLFCLLSEIKKNYVKNIKKLILLYKLIGHTRDIISGKGEYELSYMQIYVWYQFFPRLAEFAFKQFVLPDCKMHPYGSWKDIKLFCNYIKNKTNNVDHPLILFSMGLMLQQIQRDEYSIMNEDPCHISLAGKWAPRQRSKHWWLFNKMAFQYYYYYFINIGNYDLAKKKAKTNFRKLLSRLNFYLKTPQIFMCSKKWEQMTNVSSITLLKNRKAFLKNNSHLLKNLPAKKCSVGEIVKAALNSKTKKEDILINKLWKKNSSINKKIKNIIPILDTSIHSIKDNYEPLYNAIGLAIRISEKSSFPFKNRLFIYNDSPDWIVFDQNQTFVEKVRYIYQFFSPSRNNFISLLHMIYDAIVQNKISPYDVSQIKFIVLTSKHTYENFYLHSYISNIFYNTMPRFIFWNLSENIFFPTNQPNISFFSGYNSRMLNILSSKKKFQIKNSYNVLEDLLSCNRYDILTKRLIQLV